MMQLRSLKAAGAAAVACGLGVLGASPALAASTEKQVPAGIDAAGIPNLSRLAPDFASGR